MKKCYRIDTRKLLRHNQRNVQLRRVSSLQQPIHNAYKHNTHMHYAYIHNAYMHNLSYHFVRIV